MQALTGMRSAIRCMAATSALLVSATLALASELACRERLQEATLLGEDEAQRLCAGSDTTGPAYCFAAATARTMLSDTNAVELCTCARSAAPVDCFERGATKSSLSEAELVQMCRPERVPVGLWRWRCPNAP